MTRFGRSGHRGWLMLIVALAILTQAPTPSVRVLASCGALQARIDAASSGSTLDLSGCTYSTRATVNKRLVIVGGTIKVTGGVAALTVTANDVTLQGMQIIGSNKTSFNSNEYGVYALGTASAPIQRLTIRDVDINSFGNDGIYAKYVLDLTVTGSTIRDTVYAGVLVISGKGGRIDGNIIQRIGVNGSAANGNNAYGIALTDQ